MRSGNHFKAWCLHLLVCKVDMPLSLLVWLVRPGRGLQCQYQPLFSGLAAALGRVRPNGRGCSESRTLEGVPRQSPCPSATKMGEEGILWGLGARMSGAGPPPERWVLLLQAPGKPPSHICSHRQLHGQLHPKVSGRRPQSCENNRSESHLRRAGDGHLIEMGMWSSC